MKIKETKLNDTRRIKMINWLNHNKEWLFSGIAVSIPLAIVGWFFSSSSKNTNQKLNSGENSTNIQVGGNLILNDKVKNDD
ncbi:MAG: hypothetical protein K0R71_1405 [Bacillales bacterium]|jgi:hypothetical protein|nr:hypothetical protein [Bacillales bacterium]